MLGDEFLERGGIAFAIFPGVAGEDESGANGRGLGTLLGSEVLVAAAQGEAVGLADGVDGVDDDVEVEITNEAADDGDLLVVLFAEDGVVALDEVEELGDDGADAVEVAGAAGAAEGLGEAGFEKLDAAVRRVEVLGFRGEDHVCAVVAAEAEIFDEGARIFGEIFVGSELQRIDEETDDDVAIRTGDLTCGADEFGMALVEGAHGRHEDAAGSLVDGAPGAKLADVVDDVHDFRSLDSNTA